MANTRRIKRYGWVKDHLDHRDIKLTLGEPVPLPPSSDLRPSTFTPPIYDQGDLGSCTANAIAAGIDFERKKQGESFLFPSRLFIYYNERVIEGDPEQDNGAEIRDGIKSVASQGVCSESEWPYYITQFAVKPPDSCYADGAKFEALKYASVPQDERAIKTVLQQRPIVFGISAFDSFESDAAIRTGQVPMPGPNDSPIGGHAICLWGYDDSTKTFIFRNSWGASYGQSGYGFLPYDYVLNPQLGSDFWVITLES